MMDRTLFHRKRKVCDEEKCVLRDRTLFHQFRNLTKIHQMEKLSPWQIHVECVDPHLCLRVCLYAVNVGVV